MLQICPKIIFIAFLDISENRFGDKNASGLTTLSMGSENPFPSSTLKTKNIQKTPDTSRSNSLDLKSNCGVSLKKEKKHEKCISVGNTNRVKENLDKRPVYCICRQEERPGMLGCDYCDEWYHRQCLGLPKADVKRLADANWSCPNCELKKGKLHYKILDIRRSITSK